MHLVSFIIRIYHDVRSPECQIHLFSCLFLLLEQLREGVGDEAIVIRYDREDGGKNFRVVYG